MYTQHTPMHWNGMQRSDKRPILSMLFTVVWCLHKTAFDWKISDQHIPRRRKILLLIPVESPLGLCPMASNCVIACHNQIQQSITIQEAIETSNLKFV